MHYEEHPPPAGLSGHVECLWIFQAETGPYRQRHHVIVPDGAVSVSCLIAPGGVSGATVVGPADRAHRSDLMEGAVYGGVRLRPGAAGSVLHADIAILRNTFAPIGPNFSGLAPIAAGMIGDDGELLDRLCKAAGQLAEASLPLDQDVIDFARSLAAAGPGEPLEALAAGAGVGMRQLRRRFLHQCGVSPKLFARLRRLRETCRTVLTSSARDLSQAAVEAGFADQAHMTNEFTRVFGESAGLVIDYLATIRHGQFLDEPAQHAAG